MSTRDWEPRDQQAFDEFDLVEHGETLQQQIKDVFLPSIAKRAQAASTMARVELAYFARKRLGRRCSCFDVESAPRTRCKTCYGQGIVGGFEKLGFKEEVIDITREDVRCVNVQPRFDKPTAPVRFGLTDGAVAGYFEVDIPLNKNKGVLDAFRTDYTAGVPDALVQVFIKAPSDSDWQVLGALDYRQLITDRLSSASLSFRVELSRANPDAVLPEFEHLFLRYQTNPTGPAQKDRPGTFVYADIERTPRALSASDMGLFRAFEERKTFLDGALRNVTTEDFFEQLDTKDRWKVINVNDGTSQGVLFEWALNTRVVQKQEDAYDFVP